MNTGTVDALRALAGELGVIEHWTDAQGRDHTVGAETMLAVLGAFGDALAGPAEAAALLAHRHAERARQWTEPVIVVWDGRNGDATLRVPERHRNALVTCRLSCEDGRVFEWNVRPGSVGPDRRLALPREMPLGYHRLELSGTGIEHAALVIASPSRGAASRPHRRGARPELGVFLPLYAARSRAHPAMGTLTELDQLGRLAHDHGASVVATLPLLSGFAGEPTVDSPYMPVSRRFFHEIWIDTTAIAEAAPHVAPTGAGRLVDRRAVMAATSAVLEAAVDALAHGNPERARAFDAFVARHPEVLEYARFRAAGETHGANWRAWPTAWRTGPIPDHALDPRAVRRWAYGQWVLQDQLAALAAHFEQRGQVLALDLPLGVHPDGYDVWASSDQYLHGLSTGAPPDGFFTRGQSWGFPPPNPQAGRARGHADWRAALRAHLQVGRLLRIDHVMGLQRVFCVPDGMDPTEGAYVAMPCEELFAVVCLEAFRHHADVYGEDLGTVDPAVRASMAAHGMRRSYVAQFSVRDTPEPAVFAPLEPAPAGSVASFGTHDLPTFAGWWTAAEVAEREALGHMDAREASAARHERTDQRRVLARLVPGVDPDAEEAPAPVLAAVHRELMAGDAGIVVVSVEDLLMEPDAQNLPGTSHERPNWRAAAARTLDEIADDPTVGPALDALQAPRRRTMTATDDYVRPAETITGVTLLSDDDLHLFNEGRHFRLHEKLGAHLLETNGVPGTYFAVWAPNADAVSVVGDFDGWDDRRHPLAARGSSGIWEGFVPGVGRGALYKYRLRTRKGEILEKADPFAFACEEPPRTASVVWDLSRRWHDDAWMRSRAEHQGPTRPMSIYEVHLGSWMRVPEEGNRWLTYRELAPKLAAHVKELGFTHVELLPVMEHPFFGSWGYQVTGYFAPTARYGTPDDFMALVEHLHHEGIGVILDWVPSHFPADAHGLGRFDGTHLYEHDDERQRVHPDWQSWIFNYDRHEVRSFLVSNARFWLERYHADGLRVDAVASMLYLDYSRGEGEWIPNRYGGRENLGAIELLRDVNTEVYAAFPDTLTIAEESTAWPGVSRPAYLGGLGFGFKWDMGWMHDTLDYLSHDPVHRRYHHDRITFHQVYAHSENFVLPLSHDEVVHGKGSLLGKMPGDDWQRFANLRLLYGYEWTVPGKKLLFMGGELATRREWDHESSLDWSLLGSDAHAGMARWLAHLNALYRREPALFEGDHDPQGFAWIDCRDHEHSVVCFERRALDGRSVVVVVNFTPVPRNPYRVGLPGPGRWHVVANSDDPHYWGSAYPGPAAYDAQPQGWHERDWSAPLVLPPLSVLVLAPEPWS